MVQYVFTPWRDRQELLLVREQFYGTGGEADGATAQLRYGLQEMQQNRRHNGGDSDDYERDPALTREKVPARRPAQEDRRQQQVQQQQAVARVSMWMQRGNCPHMVESTALLMAAVLSDEGLASATGMGSTGASTYAIRAAYSAAFSRFVTGLLDGHQDKQRKQSMYSIAKNIGLPATFVELRHQATHEQLPSLAKLRSAARKALEWIWSYYWKHLGDMEEKKDPCREVILSYLREEDEDGRRKLLEQLKQWDLDQVLKTIAVLQETLPGNQVFLKCLKLSKELMALRAEAKKEPKPRDQETGMSGVTESETQTETEESTTITTGWSRYSGEWKPKPIGMV